MVDIRDSQRPSEALAVERLSECLYNAMRLIAEIGQCLQECFLAVELGVLFEAVRGLYL
jgi:hypothetical protein